MTPFKPAIMRNPCCCMSVRTGALIVGILEIIGSCVFVLANILALAGVAVIAHESKKDPAFAEKNNITPEDQKTFTVVAAIGTVVAVLILIVASLLVHGIVKTKSKLVLPWLIMAGVAIVFDIVGVILGNYYKVLRVAIRCWFWAIVFAYKKDVDAGGDGRGGMSPVATKPIGA